MGELALLVPLQLRAIQATLLLCRIVRASHRSQHAESERRPGIFPEVSFLLATIFIDI